MELKKILFVLNPTAGKKKANRYLTDILAAFNQTGCQVLVHVTGYAGDAARITEETAKDMDAIVCCGGDGTFNEVMSGLLKSGADIPIGYIPAGSTNDFAASLRLPRQVLPAAQSIVEGQPRRYDVGLFGQRYFSYVASFGAFTHASYATPQNVKNALGHTAYLLAGISEISQIRKIHMKLELDNDVIEDDFLFGAVSNSTSVGGVLTLDPKQVDMCDGKFEVLLVRAPKDVLEIPECIRALQTRSYNCKMITFASSSKIIATCPEELTWTLDGEAAAVSGPIEIQNLHKAISLLQKG